MPQDLSKRHYPDDFKYLTKPPKTYTVNRGVSRQLARDLKSHQAKHHLQDLGMLKPELIFWKNPNYKQSMQKKASEVQNYKSDKLIRRSSEPRNLRQAKVTKRASSQISLRQQTLVRTRSEPRNPRQEKPSRHLVYNGRYQSLNLRKPNQKGSPLVRAGSALLLLDPQKVRYHYGELVPCPR